MTETEATNIGVVRRYFDGCGTGDLDVLLGTLAPDVVHYFLDPKFPPIRGAEHLARHWRKFKTLLDPVWSIDRVVARDDAVVVEWSCLWTPTRTGKRILMRGTDWYVMRDARIAEVRAYFIHDDARDVALVEFPYAARGYLTA